MRAREPIHHRRRRRTLSPQSLATALLFTTYATSQPIPASILQTWTSAGNPLLHIQPAFHHSTTTTSTSLVSFKSAFLAHDSGIDSTLLSDSFTQDVEGVQIPNLQLEKGRGIVIFNDERKVWNGTDTGDVWVMTYPLSCGDVGNATVGDYEVRTTRTGESGWNDAKIGKEGNSSLWFPSGRYLGRGFADLESGIGKFYSFGGLCIGDGNYTGAGVNDTFSSDVWRIQNTTRVVERRGEQGRSAEPDLSIDIAISKNPPIPEAGFSMTPLPVNGTNGTEISDGMLILGGYTSSSRFVGLGQIAIYSAEDEGWNFVTATLTEPYINARAGHSAVIDEDGQRVILFGGWLGNITQAAAPSLLSLKVGDLDGGWEWESLNTTEESPGVGPGNLTLWGHAATLLDGNVMLITSGFEIGDLDENGNQNINGRTFFLNLTSNMWISKYEYPQGFLSRTAIDESDKVNGRDIGIIAGVLGGVFLLAIFAIILFCYARRREEYEDIPNDTLSTGQDKFHSLDLEDGKTQTIDGVTPLGYTRSHRNSKRNDQADHNLLPDGPSPSPELPPLPVHTRTNNHPSHIDMNRVTELREEQERRENMFQKTVERRKSTRSVRSVRSDMVAWVREWANADAAAQAAEVLKKAREDHLPPARPRTANAEAKDKNRALKHLFVPDSNRCITSSSMYSEGQVSTLTASEIYDTPVEEVPYPVPPILLSTCQAFEEQSPRHPRVLVGPDGVTAPLPKKMAQEFPNQILIPRDSIAPSSSYGNGYTYPYSGNKPLLRQSKAFDTWQDAAPQDVTGEKFYTIPLTTFEETRTRLKGKSLEDRVREEMYNPGPARTEEECRLSSIMDYYEDKPPTPIPELLDEEQRSLDTFPSSAYSGDDTVIGERAKMVDIRNHSIDEPVAVVSPRLRNPRESVIAPLLSEQDSSKRKDKPAERGVSTRSGSSFSSIKRRAAAMAATLSHERRRSSSLGKQRNVLRRRDAKATTTGPETSLLQPQRAEIEHINDNITEPAVNNNTRNDDDDMGMDDKVVQFMYTAPKGKLRVVNPSPRRVSSGGTDKSSFYSQPPIQQRRVSSAGAFGVISNPEAILRLGSTAGRRFTELD
ncbi:hypothetical protein ABW19_dt0207443 [Dactylella cylindrospora]|nr:hypothetical protein ABW19_dt0207443 [Dactylella cylindrospora]